MSGLRSFVVLLAVTVALLPWRVWPVADDAADEATGAAPADARPVTHRYVPLIGGVLEEAVDESDGDINEHPPRDAPAGPVKTCLPFLAPYLEHPNWRLRITRGRHSSVGHGIEDDFTIDSAGEVTWSLPWGPVRHLALSSEQLALVRRLDQLSCVELQRNPQNRRERGFLAIGLDLGGYDPWGDFGAAQIQPASVLGRAVNAMLDDLAVQYRGPRREAIGSIDLRVVTTDPGPLYRARIAGDRLTVKHGPKLLVDEPVESDALVDLVDAILGRPVVDEHFAVHSPRVKGVLLMHGRSVPVILSGYGEGPFQQIFRAIGDAEYREEQAREARAK